MAALNFPSSPSNGQTYTANNVTYVWNGTAWKKNIPSQNPVSGINTVGGVVGIANDLDVDGHTNLDNVSIAGVTTFGNNITASGTSRFEIASMENGLLDGSIDHTGDTTTKIQFETSVIKLDTAGTTRINVNNSGATVTGTLSATSFSGDGSNLTGTSVVKQVREAASTGQSGTGQSYTDKVTLTMTVQNNSRVLIISSYELESSTPFGSGNNTMAKTIKVGGSFVGEEVVNAHNGYYSYSGSKKYDIFYDTDNGAGSRSYKIQWKRNTSGTGYIKNARLLGIELGIGP